MQAAITFVPFRTSDLLYLCALEYMEARQQLAQGIASAMNHHCGDIEHAC